MHTSEHASKVPTLPGSGPDSRPNSTATMSTSNLIANAPTPLLPKRDAGLRAWFAYEDAALN